MVRRNIWLRTFTLVAVESGIIDRGVLLSLYWLFAPDYHALLLSSGHLQDSSSRPSSAVHLLPLRSLRLSTRGHAANSSRASFKLSPRLAYCFGLIFLLLPKLLLGYAEQEGRVSYAQGVPTTAMVLTLRFHDCWRIVIHWLLSLRA